MKPAKPRILVKTRHQGIAVVDNDTIFSLCFVSHSCCDASVLNISLWHMLFVDYVPFFSLHCLTQNICCIYQYTVSTAIAVCQQAQKKDVQHQSVTTVQSDSVAGLNSRLKWVYAGVGVIVVCNAALRLPIFCCILETTATLHPNFD